MPIKVLTPTTVCVRPIYVKEFSPYLDAVKGIIILVCQRYVVHGYFGHIQLILCISFYAGRVWMSAYVISRELLSD